MNLRCSTLSLRSATSGSGSRDAPSSISESMSYLKYPPVRGTVWTSYTCTHPAYRGRGLAKGVKLQGLAQAVELGVPSVCTDNDSKNAPMLRINQQLGYEPRPGFVEHHKRVTNQGA